MSTSTFSTSQHRPTFVLFGDSLTQNSFTDNGWGSMLYAHYCRKADVVNRGFSGYNSAWCHKVAPQAIPERAQLVTLWLGANDAVLHSSGIAQYVPLAEYKQNLVKLVRLFVKRYTTDVKILVITPPPVCEARRLEFQVERFGDLASGILDRTNRNTYLYARTCAQVVDELKSECNVHLLDIFSTMFHSRVLPESASLEEWLSDATKEAATSETLRPLLHDGLHFSAEGNRFVFQQVLSAIERGFPSLAFGSLLNSFPWHDQFKCNPTIMDAVGLEKRWDSLTIYNDVMVWDWSSLSFERYNWLGVADGKVVAFSNRMDASAATGRVAGCDGPLSQDQLRNLVRGDAAQRVVDGTGLFIMPGLALPRVPAEVLSTYVETVGGQQSEKVAVALKHLHSLGVTSLHVVGQMPAAFKSKLEGSTSVRVFVEDSAPLSGAAAPSEEATTWTKAADTSQVEVESSEPTTLVRGISSGRRCFPGFPMDLAKEGGLLFPRMMNNFGDGVKLGHAVYLCCLAGQSFVPPRAKSGRLELGYPADLIVTRGDPAVLEVEVVDVQTGSIE